MKACAKVCWCTQGIWTMISEPSVREPKASDAPCMSASVCNVKVFLHFHLFTNHASLRLPQRRDWLCYACPLSPAVCVNAQGYKHTEKKKSSSLWQHLVQYHWTQDAQEFTTCYHQEWLNRINDIYGNTKEVTPMWWSIYRSTYLYPSGIIAIITPNLL